MTHSPERNLYILPVPLRCSEKQRADMFVPNCNKSAYYGGLTRYYVMVS